MQLVDQIVNQQMVPERPAREQEDFPARSLFERGDFGERIRPFDDARVLPVPELFGTQMIGDDDFFDGPYQLRKLTPDRAGIGVLQHARPIFLVAEKGAATTQQEGIGGAHPLCVVMIEVLVTVVVFVVVIEDGVEAFVFPIIVAVQGNKVADNEFAHKPIPPNDYTKVFQTSCKRRSISSE